MTRITTKIAALVLVSAVFAGNALASDVTVKTSPGKRVLASQFALFASDTCYAGALPEARIAQQPQHGKLEIGQESKQARAGNCGGMLIHYRTVYYTPNAGFRGTDTFSVDYLYNMFSDAPRPTNRRRTTTVTVQ